MPELTASQKLLSIIGMVGVGSNAQIVQGAIAQLRPLVKSIKELEDENARLKAKLQALGSV